MDSETDATPDPTPPPPPPAPDLHQIVSATLPPLAEVEAGWGEDWAKPVTALGAQDGPLAAYQAHMATEPPETRSERAAWHDEARRLEQVARDAITDATEHHGLQAERKRWADARAAADAVDMAQANSGTDFLSSMFGTKASPQKAKKAEPSPPQKLGRW